MMRFAAYFTCSLLMLIAACESREKTDAVRVPDPVDQPVATAMSSLDSATFHDKVLGALAGSAIGDAMGASTEMWTRADIRREYGYITGLTLVERSKSPEGTWDHQMDTGATTDDTRWKYLMVKYKTRHQEQMSVAHFVDFIVDYYQSEVKGLADEAILTNTDLLDHQMQRIDWIKEWARVALAYQQGDMAYTVAQSRFYGGEMSCAGMLYTPMFGLTAASPEEAYKVGYEHGMFDIGYARDIAGLVSGMTQMAMHADSLDVVLRQGILIDPYDYMDSRLISRLAYEIAKDSRTMIQSLEQLEETYTVDVKVPVGFPGSKEDWVRQQIIYDQLEERQKAIAFHAGEIWQILNVGMLYGGGDFEKTMQFIVNYGRDNDTVAAVAGMILGAQCGYSKLPVDLKEKVVEVSREVMGIDLELLAEELVRSQLELKTRTKPSVN